MDAVGLQAKIVPHDLLVIALAVSVLAGNFAVSVQVIRSSLHSRKQRIVQLAIVWLMPVLGAIVIGLFYRSVGRSASSSVAHTRDEQEYPGVNLYPPHGPSDE